MRSRGRRAPQEPQGEPDEARPEQRRGDRVDPAERPERDRDERGCHEQQRVEQDLPCARLRAAHGRQHRHAGARVVLVEQQRQRPEVGRSPEEHDREQRDGRRTDRAVDCGPGDERRHGAGRSADDDVLRRPPLEPDRVDEHVAGEAGEGPDGGEPVHLERQQRDARRSEHEAEGERVRRARRGRWRPGAQLVRSMSASMSRSYQWLIALEPPGHEHHAEHRPGDDAVAGPAVCRQRERADRRDDDQQHDARLEQLPVVVRACCSLCPEARRGSETRRGAAGGHAASLPLVGVVFGKGGTDAQRPPHEYGVAGAIGRVDRD